MNQKICTLIPAAGSGNRMGDPHTKKTYLSLLDLPVLSQTIRVFDLNPIISDILVIVSEGDLSNCQAVAITPYDFSKVLNLVVGGSTRQESVYNGLNFVPEDTQLVIVHDGVRPFVTDKMIHECVSSASKFGAAAVAVPTKDTIKVIDENQFSVETPNRDQLWAVQTPQCFRKDLLVKAHRQAKVNQVEVTDDAALVEQLGFKVKLVMGSYNNLKITTPEDMVVARAFAHLPNTVESI
ncbi:2-C-methyl-D-erythritol 4-phosphate cytidylyltransferase [Candidatus Poribacteria bacterium]|nr:2-C-methyl-D-erythritol 4-phosphate cytidylyltransferase [Candidatus Poribacteria bacterium]